MKRFEALAALLIGAAIAACGDDTTGPSADSNLNPDVAVVAAASATEDLAAMQDTEIDEGNLQGGAAFKLNGCIFNSANSRFDCPVKTHDGLVITRSFAFFNASSAPMTGFDEQLTASANLKSDAIGTVSRGSWTATIDWHRDFTVTGLLGTETSRTWNGSSDASVQGSHHTGNGDRSYDMTMHSVVHDVVIPVGEDHNRPSSGTLTQTVTVTYVGGKFDGQTVTRTVNITFDGSQEAKLKIGKNHFKLNLGSRLVVKDD